MRNAMKNTNAIFLPMKLETQLKSIFEVPCTLVEAPMGYGKTTSIREFLKQSEAQIIWLKVYDSSLSGFWASFCRQFRDIDLECANSLSQIEFSKDSTSQDKILQILQEAVLSSKVVVVIDDYHLISTPSVDRFFEFLMWNELTDIHIVLTARYSRFDNLEELVLKGYLHHIPKEYLEFDAQEIAFYYKCCGLHLKPAECRQLEVYTEGWISALYLLMLDMKEEKKISANTNITNLLDKTVYQPFSDEIKTFLITHCIFESFSLKQSQSLWQKGNSKALLDEITGKNAFVYYDEKTKTYQIHNLFSGFLKVYFESMPLTDKHAIYAKAAQWFGSVKDYEAALNYYHLSGDYNSLMATYVESIGQCFTREHLDLLRLYFSECPKEIRLSYPIALLIYALFLFACNEMPIFEQICQELSEAIAIFEAEDPQMAQKIKGEFELLLIFTAYNDVDQMIKHIQNAYDLLQEPAQFIDTRGGWTLGSPSVLYMFYREAGLLSHHVNRLKEGLPQYNLLARGHGKGGEHAMEAEWHYMKGDFIHSEITVHKALYDAQNHKQVDILLCAAFIQARLSLAKGDYYHAHYALSHFKDEMKYQSLYNLSESLDLCEAFILAQLKQLDQIPKWIVEGDHQSVNLYFPVLPFFNIIVGRILLVQGEFLKLIGLQAHFNAIASAFPNVLASVYSLIYEAAAYEHILRREAALASLRAALDIAGQDQVYMPFVENSDYIKPLLSELNRSGAYSHCIPAILRLIIPYESSLQQIAKHFVANQKPELTERELEIAKLVAQGLSNNEIGRQLFISTNTVKTMLKRIFEKLGINSRSLLNTACIDSLSR